MADSTIITGQYVQIEQTPANAGERMLARIVDYILMTVYGFAFSYFIGIISAIIPYYNYELTFVLYIIFLFPIMFYSLIWELFNRGQSPGKKLLGIRVVMKDGTMPKLSVYLLRWLMLIVDVYLLQGSGLLSILLTKNSQRIGDLAAGTLVIKEKDFRKINVTLDEFRHLSVDYRPVFPQAENLSLEQINLINQTLFRFDAERPLRIRELAAKVRQFLKINPPVSDEALLKTLTRDFQYYALEEI